MPELTFTLTEINSIPIAEITSAQVILSSVADALDIIGNCNYSGAYHIIIDEKQIEPDFFNLKSGLAGEILQKFSTYRSKLAIVGDFKKYTSTSLQQFIMESNKTGHVLFLPTSEEAVRRFST